MSWNGEIVIDLDSHIVERADRFYQDYIDPAYRGAYQHLRDGAAQQAEGGHRYSLSRRPTRGQGADRGGGPARHARHLRLEPPVRDEWGPHGVPAGPRGR